MKKTLLSVLALTLLTSTSAWATSMRLSIDCKAGKGDDVISATFHMFEGIKIDTYLTSFVFPKSSITKNDSEGIEASVDKMVRYAEGEEIIDENVKLKMKFIRSEKVGQLLLIEELSANGERTSNANVRVLKCN